MKRDDTVYLRHILDATESIEDYTRGMSENEFLSNSMAHDAVVRQIEIIGEAARNVSYEFQTKHSKLPWEKGLVSETKSSMNISILIMQSCGIR